MKEPLEHGSGSGHPGRQFVDCGVSVAPSGLQLLLPAATVASAVERDLSFGMVVSAATYKLQTGAFVAQRQEPFPLYPRAARNGRV